MKTETNSVTNGEGRQRSSETMSEKEHNRLYDYKENSDTRWHRVVIIVATYAFIAIMTSIIKGG
jgi:hypothetical protein